MHGFGGPMYDGVFLDRPGIQARRRTRGGHGYYVFDLQAVMDDARWRSFFESFLPLVAERELFIIIDSHNRDVISSAGLSKAIGAYRSAGINRVRIAFVIEYRGYGGATQLFSALAELEGFDAYARVFDDFGDAEDWLMEQANH